MLCSLQWLLLSKPLSQRWTILTPPVRSHRTIQVLHYLEIWSQTVIYHTRPPSQQELPILLHVDSQGCWKPASQAKNLFPPLQNSHLPAGGWIEQRNFCRKQNESRINARHVFARTEILIRSREFRVVVWWKNLFTGHSFKVSIRILHFLKILFKPLTVRSRLWELGQQMETFRSNFLSRGIFQVYDRCVWCRKLGLYSLQAESQSEPHLGLYQT